MHPLAHTNYNDGHLANKIMKINSSISIVMAYSSWS